MSRLSQNPPTSSASTFVDQEDRVELVGSPCCPPPALGCGRTQGVPPCKPLGSSARTSARQIRSARRRLYRRHVERCPVLPSVDLVAPAREAPDVEAHHPSRPPPPSMRTPALHVPSPQPAATSFGDATNLSPGTPSTPRLAGHAGRDQCVRFSPPGHTDWRHCRTPNEARAIRGVDFETGKATRFLGFGGRFDRRLPSVSRRGA